MLEVLEYNVVAVYVWHKFHFKSFNSFLHSLPPMVWRHWHDVTTLCNFTLCIVKMVVRHLLTVLEEVVREQCRLDCRACQGVSPATTGRRLEIRFPGCRRDGTPTLPLDTEQFRRHPGRN